MPPASQSKRSSRKKQEEVPPPPVRLKQRSFRAAERADWLDPTAGSKESFTSFRSKNSTSEGEVEWPCLGTRARRRLKASHSEISLPTRSMCTTIPTANKVEYPCLGTRSRKKLLAAQSKVETCTPTQGKPKSQKESVLTIQERRAFTKHPRSTQTGLILLGSKEPVHVASTLNETPLKSTSYCKELPPRTTSKKKINVVYAPRKEVSNASRRSKRKLYKAQVLAQQELDVTFCSGPRLFSPEQNLDRVTTASPSTQNTREELVSGTAGSELKLNSAHQVTVSSKKLCAVELKLTHKKAQLDACASEPTPTDIVCPSDKFHRVKPSVVASTLNAVPSTSGAGLQPSVACTSKIKNVTAGVSNQSALQNEGGANVQWPSEDSLSKLLTATLATRLKEKLTCKPLSSGDDPHNVDYHKKSTAHHDSSVSALPADVQETKTSITKQAVDNSEQLSSAEHPASRAACNYDVPMVCSAEKLKVESQKLLTSILALRLKQKINERPIQRGSACEPGESCSKPNITTNLASRLKQKLNKLSDSPKPSELGEPNPEANSDIGQLATETLAFRLKQIINAAQAEKELTSRLSLENLGPSTSSQQVGVTSKRKISEESECRPYLEDVPPKRCKSCVCAKNSASTDMSKCKVSLNMCSLTEHNVQTNDSCAKNHSSWDMPSTSTCDALLQLPQAGSPKDLELSKSSKEHSKDSILKRLETVLMATFRKRFSLPSTIPDILPVEPEPVVSSTFRPSNFVTYQYINQRTLGSRSSKVVIEPVFSPVVNHLSQLTVYKTASPFDRRATAMAWHPTCPSSLAVASKGGDIILWNFESAREDLFIPGIGAGGSVLAMKFHKHDPTLLYTAALDGKVCLQDFQGKNSRIILDTMNWDQWFCSLDVSVHERMLVAGDSLGNVTLMTNYGEKAWSFRLHRSKVSHVEFSPRESWLLATTSIDSTLKIWDIRNVKNRDSALHVCRHDKPVNSAYFSLQNGTRILTTDQHSELRIYKGPLWNLEMVIPHPHRQFQHLTPIKAHWHPLVDVAVVGRYPDEHFPGYVPGERRSVDFFSAETGNMSYQLTEQGVVGIISLNQFNNTGEVLASCMGYNILIWKNKDDVTAQRRLQHQNSAKQVRHFKTTFYQRPQRSRQDENNSSGMNVTSNNSNSNNTNHNNNNNNNNNSSINHNSSSNNLNSTEAGKRKCVRSLLVDNSNLNATVC